METCLPSSYVSLLHFSYVKCETSFFVVSCLRLFQNYLKSSCHVMMKSFSVLCFVQHKKGCEIALVSHASWYDGECIELAVQA